MKKLMLCLSVAGVLGVSLKIATAEETSVKPAVVTVAPQSLDSYISEVYNQIDFRGKEKISFDAFSTAFTGYLNLRKEGKLNENKDILTVADFSLSSQKHRLWIFDLKNKTVLLNDYVAHGQGSGDEFATAFSNRENSHQSSLGFYVTGDTYIGKHGNSLRLYGMDEGYNSAAYQRAVVVHGADYVSASFVAGQNRLGRSWGCPAVSNKVIGKVIDYIEGGTCLFVYYPHKNYLASSPWLKNSGNLMQEIHMLHEENRDVANVSNQAPMKVVYADNAQFLNPESPLYVAPELRAQRALMLATDFGFVRNILP